MQVPITLVKIMWFTHLSRLGSRPKSGLMHGYSENGNETHHKRTLRNIVFRASLPTPDQIAGDCFNCLHSSPEAFITLHDQEIGEIEVPSPRATRLPNHVAVKSAKRGRHLGSPSWICIFGQVQEISHEGPVINATARLSVKPFAGH